MHMPADISRRRLLKQSVLVCSVIVAGTPLMLTPAQAYAAGASLQVLSQAQSKALAVVGEQLVPGSVAAGLVEYIDSQLAAGADSLLMLKYLGVDWTGHRDFYGAALDSLARYLGAASSEAHTLAGLMATDAVPEWQGPPASFVYFVLRSDAIDVRWGQREGHESLGIPYAAHIDPPTHW